ncbi:Hypp1656 [Branchiostoma lanceolatum]|uniref:Hypp1656 protein n=1 Tax=Branchiostoma lanceolatum TaxID=7740 RepID=A0A8J9ZJF7_BRALA|nr:Hypp1656 [Branchiostoma lanceolatum]
MCETKGVRTDESSDSPGCMVQTSPAADAEMEDSTSKQHYDEDYPCNKSYAVEYREDADDHGYEGCDMQEYSPASETIEIPDYSRPLCNTYHSGPKFARSINSAYAKNFPDAITTTLRNEQNPSPMYAPSSRDGRHERPQNDDNSSGITPVSVGSKTGMGQASSEDNACIQPVALSYDENDKTAPRPPSGVPDDNGTAQDSKNDAPPFGPPAYSDSGDTRSVLSSAVRYKENDDDDRIQPYAVRYEGHGDGDSMSANSVTAPRSGQTFSISNDDAVIQPYAVAYMYQNSGDDVAAIPVPNSAAWNNAGSPAAVKEVRHPPARMVRNRMYGQNQGLEGRRNHPHTALASKFILVLFITGGTFVGGYFYASTKTPPPAMDITYTPDQSDMDTAYTTGHSALNTTYTPGHPAVDTTNTPMVATYSPGPPAVDTTYIPGLPAVDTTYTSRKIVFGGEGSEPGKFKGSLGVAVSADSEIFVADRENQRV